MSNEFAGDGRLRVSHEGGYSLMSPEDIRAWGSPGKGAPRVPSRLLRMARQNRASERFALPAEIDAAPVSWGPPVRYVEIPNGEKGTIATLKVMKWLVLSPWGHRHPEVVQLARMIASEVPSKDYRGQAQSLFDFMSIGRQAGVKYLLDPAGLEYVPSPWHTLMVSGEEDCDGHATAFAALAMALGHRAGFRTVKADTDRSDQWSHVYGVIGIREPGKDMEWLSADTTQAEADLGWNPPEGKIHGMKTWVIDPGLEG